jgi:hypothetical protein
MIRNCMTSFFNNTTMLFLLLVGTHNVAADGHDTNVDSNKSKIIELEMQLQTLQARENVKHKMLEDKIAMVEVRMDELERALKVVESEVAFLRRAVR